MLVGLRGKIALLYVAAVLFIIGSSVLISITSLTDAFNKQYREKALAIVRTFDARYNNLREIQDSRITQAHIDRLMSMNPNIYRISLYQPLGDAIVRSASSDKSQIGLLADDYEAEPIGTGRIVFYDKVKEGERLVQVLAPLHADGKPVAAIGVYLRIQPRDDVVQEQAMRFAFIGIFAAALLLVLGYLSLDRLLLNPLLMLKHSAQAIQRGCLSTRVILGRKDEFGELAATFNLMAETLEKRENENQDLHKQLQERYAQAAEQAVTDPITGLFNHRHFQSRLANELERARRFGTSVTLLFVDIDNFKAINDVRGHQFGDQVLREIAQLLKGTVREIDIVARYGGEEFAIILPGTSGESGYKTGERIRRAVANYRFGADSDFQQMISISVGVASHPDDAQSREDLIWKADRAMYLAKQVGRNQVRMYGELTDSTEGNESLDYGDRGVPDQEPYHSLMRALVAAVDARDGYDRAHSLAVASYAASIALAMGVRGAEVRKIGIAGLIHEIGQMGMPDTVLNNSLPGGGERSGAAGNPDGPTVGQYTALDQVLPLIASYRERFDGQGLPSSLRGHQIPLGARILAVADAYHTMNFSRPYRQAGSHGEAIVQLRRGAGTQFDPAVIEAFIGVLEHDLDAGKKLFA